MKQLKFLKFGEKQGILRKKKLLKMTKSVPLMFDFRESFVFRATEGADHEDSCSCKGG